MGHAGLYAIAYDWISSFLNSFLLVYRFILFLRYLGLLRWTPVPQLHETVKTQM